MTLNTRLKSLLEKRRKGAVALLAVVALIPMTAMISASVNTGQSFEDRRRTQDAADALALTHATWSARSLNTISMNNVTIAQLMTVAIGTEALEFTIWEYAATIRNINQFRNDQNRLCEAANAVPIIGNGYARFCRGWNNAVIGAPLTVAGAYLAYLEARYQPLVGMYAAHRSLGAMGDMNEEIVERFPEAMRAIAEDYADEFDIDGYHFVEPCAGEGPCDGNRVGLGMSLPVERSLLERVELCEGMHRGNASRVPGVTVRGSFEARDFQNGFGPMTNGGHVRDHIEEETDIDTALSLFKRYYDFPLVFALPWPRMVPSGDRLQGDQSSGDNTFTRSFDSKTALTCGNVVSSSLSYGEVHSFNGYNVQALLAAPLIQPPRTWWPIGASLAEMSRTRPEEMDPAYRVLVIARTEPAQHMGNDVLNSKPMHHFAHAEATIFNPDSGDFYTQNWRTRLTPASRMDRPRDVAADLRDHAPGAFSDLARALDAVRSAEGWSRINAH